MLDGNDVSTLSASTRAQLGVAHIPQGRGTFVDFTVEENLALGAYMVRDKQTIGRALDYWYDIFPWLAERRGPPPRGPFGGGRPKLPGARALLAPPRLLMCDA